MNQNLDLIWAAHATESTGRHYVNSIISLSLSQPHREFSSSLLFSFWGGRISSPHVLWPFTGSSRSPWRPTARRERERYIVVDPRTFACREKTGDKCLHKNRRRKNSMTQRERLLFFFYTFCSFCQRREFQFSLFWLPTSVRACVNTRLGLFFRLVRQVVSLLLLLLLVYVTSSFLFFQQQLPRP